MPDTILSVPLKNEAGLRLSALAAQTGRSDAQLAADAIDAWLDIQDWQEQGIQAAIAALDSGEGISHDDVKAWVASWGNPDEQGKPQAKP